MHKERKCIGCNSKNNSENMIKLTKDYKTQEVVINPDKFCNGRSVYVCRNESCVKSALKKDKIAKMLKKKLTEVEKENINTVLNLMVVVKQ